MSSIQDSEPAEPPEPELVHTKPLHIPRPSNIPILESQDDPAFSGTEEGHDNQAPSSDHVIDSHSVLAAASAGNDSSHPTQQDHAAGDQQSSALSLPNGLSQDTNHWSSDQHAQGGIALHSPPAAPDSSLNVLPTTNLSGASPSASTATQQPAAGFVDLATAVSDASANVNYVPKASDSSNSLDHASSPDNKNRSSSSQVGGLNIKAILDSLSSTAALAQNSSLNFSSPQSSSDPSPSHLRPIPSAQSHLFSPTQSQHQQHQHQQQQEKSSIDQTSTPSLPAAPGLPPRPPSNSNPTNSISESALRSFHPHDLQSTNPQPSPGQPSSSSQPPDPSQKYVQFPGPSSLHSSGQNPPPPIPNAGAPGTSISTSSLPPPPMPAFQQQNSSSAGGTSAYRERDPPPRQTSNDYGIGDEEDDRRWSHDVQRKYDAFLEDERMWVARGEWHNFPANSRLFIGNLPSEKVTKRDLFHVFHKYGKLAQVSIKQAYGFIQYLRAEDCLKALEAEQSVSVRGRRIHLEISKPPKSHQPPNRRSRSPEHARGGGAAGSPRGADRYRGGRDGYRPGRSPSPRPRDSRRSPNNSSRRRSRSPPQYGRRRSPSPRRSPDDDCPLPRRAPQDVPDLQIIVKDDPDRNFITWVEKGFEARGIRCGVLMLSSRLSEVSVVRRQIIEGVLAVLRLDRNVPATQKFALSVFDRSGGNDKVKYEEYVDLAFNICVELVVRAKQNASRPISSQYYGLPVAPPPLAPIPPHHQPTYPSYQQPPQQQLPGPPMPPLDPASLQQLLGRAQQSTPQHGSPGISQSPPFGGQQFPPPTDLSRLLASAGGVQSPNNMNPNMPNHMAGYFANQAQTPSQQMPPQQPPPPQQPTGARQGPPQPPMQQPQQQPQQQSADIQNIMAMLQRYK